MLYFASLLDALFLQCGLQKYTFQVVSFRIERKINLLTLAKVLKLISLCNLHPRTKESCWRLLDSRLLAKTACSESRKTRSSTTLSRRKFVFSDVILREVWSFLLRMEEYDALFW